MTIIEFLEARLAEDENVAYLACANDRDKYGRWAYDGEYGAPGDGEVYAPDATRSVPLHGGRTSTEYFLITRDSEGILPSVDKDEATHIARHDPARVLREVAAKRALIKSTIKRIEEGWGYHDNEGMICADLRPMAEVYSDHPDFDAIEWE